MSQLETDGDLRTERICLCAFQPFSGLNYREQNKRTFRDHPLFLPNPVAYVHRYALHPEPSRCLHSATFSPLPQGEDLPEGGGGRWAVEEEPRPIQD